MPTYTYRYPHKTPNPIIIPVLLPWDRSILYCRMVLVHVPVYEASVYQVVGVYLITNDSSLQLWAGTSLVLLL